MTAISSNIRVDRDGRVTLITIDRPEARNAVTPEMHQALADSFDSFASDPDQWIAIITGAGDKAFCAGSDLKRAAGAGIPHTFKWSGGYGGIVSRFDLTKPVIAAVNGFAMGGGFEIALACDVVIAADTALFGLPEPAVGVAAVGGGLHRLPRQIGYKKAMGMILTGAKVSAAEGERLGFVNEVVPLDALMTTARRWADAILANSPMAIRASKDVVRRGLEEASVADAIARQHTYPGLMEMWASEDYKEGPRAFTEKRAPQWRGR
jgi:enoyl-CoA hydratase/carnithine racemase